MKLKKKLILSCAALAACATTLVSSTFAWYTSNTEVKASSVSGLTSAGTDSLLLISDTGKNGDWGATTTFDDQSYDADNKNTVTFCTNAKFVPVAWNESNADGSKPFLAMDGKTDMTNTAQSRNYLAFDLYFATGSSTALDVYVKDFSFTLTDEADAETVLTKTGLGTAFAGDSAPGTYKIDLRNALVVTTIATTITEGTEKAEDAKHYGIEAFAGKSDYTSDMNCHQYYNAVLNKTDSDKKTETLEDDPIQTTDTISATQLAKKTTGTAWSLGKAPLLSTTEGKVSALKVTFYVWLNGWDTACFDAVQGQAVTVSLSFSSLADEAAYQVGAAA